MTAHSKLQRGPAIERLLASSMLERPLHDTNIIAQYHDIANVAPEKKQMSSSYARPPNRP